MAGWKSKPVALKGRSGLEDKTIADLTERGAGYEYEKHKVGYSKPATTHKYTPDFVLGNGVIVETKGIFDVADRQKHLLVKAQHPGLDIRFVFSRSASPIRKGSKTTYAVWCRKYGFQFSDKIIPQAWLDEPLDHARMAALEAARA